MITYTALLWLLVYPGQTAWSYRPDTPPMVVERFMDEGECERMRKLIAERAGAPAVRCIQARVVRP